MKLDDIIGPWPNPRNWIGLLEMKMDKCCRDRMVVISPNSSTGRKPDGKEGHIDMNGWE